jgi:hypothetical protein
MNIRSISATDLSAEQLTAWDRLQRRDVAAAHPMFRPEFIQIAARECAGVEVAVLEQAGECVGFFPYQRDRKGVARAVAWQMSDMHGIVLQPGVRVDAKTLLQGASLRAWHFDHVPIDQKTFRRSVRCVDEAYFMDLSRGYDHYCELRRREGPSLISQTARKSRKLAGKSVLCGSNSATPATAWPMRSSHGRAHSYSGKGASIHFDCRGSRRSCDGSPRTGHRILRESFRRSTQATRLWRRTWERSAAPSFVPGSPHTTLLMRNTRQA